MTTGVTLLDTVWAGTQLSSSITINSTSLEKYCRGGRETTPLYNFNLCPTNKTETKASKYGNWRLISARNVRNYAVCHHVWISALGHIDYLLYIFFLSTRKHSYEFLRRDSDQRDKKIFSPCSTIWTEQDKKPLLTTVIIWLTVSRHISSVYSWQLHGLILGMSQIFLDLWSK